MLVLQADLAVDSCIPSISSTRFILTTPSHLNALEVQMIRMASICNASIFRKLSQILKPDGRIVIVTDNKNYGNHCARYQRSEFADFYANDTNDGHNRVIYQTRWTPCRPAQQAYFARRCPQGHSNSSTRFDNYGKGEKNRRFFICVSKSLATQDEDSTAIQVIKYENMRIKYTYGYAFIAVFCMRCTRSAQTVPSIRTKSDREDANLESAYYTILYTINLF